MEKITYFSRNGKKKPFEVTIRLEHDMVYVGCDCELGIEKKICRHKINAIRGDKDNRHTLTSDEVITKLRSLFNTSSTLRIHLEEKWRLLREFSSLHPDDVAEIGKKRKILGEAFSNGFLNESINKIREQTNIKRLEAERVTYSKGLDCLAKIEYIDSNGEITSRDVKIEEIFVFDSMFYLNGFCYLRNGTRSFRVDRIHKIDFYPDAQHKDRSILLNIIFQGSA